MKSYTIKIFMPDGDPNNIIVVNKMNWTGTGIKISRTEWDNNKNRPDVNCSGIYILLGYNGSDDIPTIYIGQGEVVRERIDSHIKNKDFWDKCIVFTSSNYSLNRAHITWLEWALIHKAKLIDRCKLDNSVEPKEPGLIESEKADIQFFLDEILSILPILEIRVFEKEKSIIVKDETPTEDTETLDTIIVPAQEEGFQEEFIGNNCWYAIRISASKLNTIKYIAAYRSSPISAITHYAEVKSIEPYGNDGKYKLYFKDNACILENEIPFGNAKKGSMQGPRYSNMKKLLLVKNIGELVN